MSKNPPDLYPDLFSNMLQSWFDPSQMRRYFNTLYEPILPNGTFAGIVINQNNSTNPQVERHVVNHYSYGRQLGTLLDAMEVLIRDASSAPTNEGDVAKLKALTEMKAKIDALKSEARDTQVEHIVKELDGLSEQDLRRCSDTIKRLMQERARRA